MRLRLEKCTDEALKDRLQADIAAMQSLALLPQLKLKTQPTP